MVKSMTSFGRSSSEEGQKRIFTVEMKSVNNRYLDINIRMPKALISLEEEVRKMISSSLSRGKVDVFINLTPVAHICHNLHPSRAFNHEHLR